MLRKLWNIRIDAFWSVVFIGSMLTAGYYMGGFKACLVCASH